MTRSGGGHRGYSSRPPTEPEAEDNMALPNPDALEPDVRFAAQVAYVTMVSTMANAAVSSMVAASQANNQLFLDSARHDANAATEELAATVKGVNAIFDGPTGNGLGSSDARQLKKIYRLLKQMMRQSGAPVVT
jgi:hypothetical protein